MKVESLIARTLGIREENVGDDLKYDSIPEWDSFNHLLLINELEKEYGIRFGMEEIDNLRSVKDIRRVIVEKTQ